MRSAGVLLVAVALAGCGGAGTKAGGDVAPITLTMGTSDAVDSPENAEIRELARRVKALSGGRIRIESRHGRGEAPHDFNQRIVRQLADGKLDMAVVPARTWDTEGITALRALSAPFLVTSDELLDAIVTSSLAGEMLESLRGAGVVGLALVPDGLRHPFGFHGLLGGPADYSGKLIRVPTSRTVIGYVESLGAKVTDAPVDEPTQEGMESGYLQGASGTATGNVVLSAKADTLVIDRDVDAKLDGEQRRILARAAEQTRDWAIDTYPDDAAAAADYCGHGGAVGVAPTVDVLALRRAGAPVYAELERDPQTRELIARIRELRDRIGAPLLGHPPKPCGGARGPGPAAEHGPTPIDGVYRFELTEPLLRRSGMTDRDEIVENTGLITWRFSKGAYCIHQKAPTPVGNPNPCGRYSVEGDRLTVGFSDGAYEIFGVSRLAGGDLDLRLIQPVAGHEPAARAVAAVRWRRVGDA